MEQANNYTLCLNKGITSQIRKLAEKKGFTMWRENNCQSVPTKYHILRIILGNTESEIIKNL